MLVAMVCGIGLLFSLFGVVYWATELTTNPTGASLSISVFLILTILNGYNMIKDMNNKS